MSGRPTTTRRRVLAAAGVSAVGAGYVRPSLDGTPYRRSDPVRNGTWPMAGRDPGRSCHVPTTSLPTADPNERWWFEPDDPLRHVRALAIGRSNVFVSGLDRLVALDEADGTADWRFAVRSEYPDANGEFRQVAAGPVLDRESLYLGLNGGGLRSVDPTAGTARWRRDVFVGDERPIPANDTVYFSHGDGPVAVDASTGVTRWSGDYGRQSVVVALHDGVLLTARFGFDEGPTELIGADAATGERRWTLPVGQEEHFFRGPVACAGGTAFVASDALRAVDVVDGSVQWTVDDGGYLATDGESVYAFGEQTGLTAYDAATGDRQWHSGGAVDATFHRSPVLTDDALYVPAEGGIAAFDAADGTRLFRHELGENGHVSELAATDDALVAAWDDGDASVVVALER